MIVCDPRYAEQLRRWQHRIMDANPSWSLSRVLLRAKIELGKQP
jgi:hypothetical protein